MYDIIIKNGTIIDGTGKEMYPGDVGIKDDKIVKIGELHNEKGEIEVDANGKLVCPGFIDVNNHSDTYWRIFLNPDLESLISQGITTIVGGNCGTSLAPLYDSKTISSVQKWIDLEKTSVNWRNLEEFFNVLEKKKLSVNFAPLIGHATLRRGVLKNDFRNLKPAEMEAMKRMLKVSLKKGSLGMSTGLIYTHAKTASDEELTELAKSIKKFGGVYATHIRGEKEELIESITEALEIAKNSGVKLHISHLKVMGEKNWKLMDDALELIERASQNGIDVTFDVYPYTNTGSVLYTLLPDWVCEGGRDIMLSRLKDPAIKAKVIQEMKESDFDYSKIEIAISSLNKTLAKKKISEIAISQGKSAEEAVIDVLVASGGRVITSMEVLSEENVEKAIAHPLSIISSNGSGYNLEHQKSGEIVHSRNFGTFPRVLSKYVAEKKILTWEEAIKKMTSFPAKKFGIKKRGELKKGNYADVIVFDKDRIKDLSTKENPYQYSKGIDFVLVNGKIALQGGEYIGSKNGRIIRR
jgi:N-acyl-D-amino-acid deacylase